jgi:protein-L-isoaspartate(D-aspartate) O-methyltransferase
VCGFVTMQGAGAHTERLLLRGKEIGLRFDDGFPDKTPPYSTERSTQRGWKSGQA